MARMRIVVLIGLSALGAPASARAGTYDVVSCRAPGAGGVNGAWEPGYGAYPNPDPEPGQFDVIQECPGPRTFLLARSKEGNGVDAFWAHSAYLRFDAPPGTTIARARLWRHGQTVRADATDGGGEEWDILAQTDDGALALEGCVPPPDQALCNTGAPEDLNGKSVSDASLGIYDLNTAFLNLGVVCVPAAFKSCATSNDDGYPYASYNLWGSIITIRDDVKPALKTSGSLWSTGWQRPEEALAYSASDSAGVGAVEARIGDATVVAKSSCDFHREAPCPRDLTGTLTLRTAPADGKRSAAVIATDAAGNRTTLTREVWIDGTPPRVDLRRPRKRTIVVRVADGASGFAAGRIYVRQGSAEPYRALPTTLARGALRAPLDRGKPSRALVRVVVRDNAGNQAAGVPARFTLTSVRSGKRQLKLQNGHVRARFGRPVTLRGKLTLSAGQRLVGIPISVMSTRGGKRSVHETSGTTGPTGRFALTVGPGPRRRLLLSYAGVGDGLPAQRRLRLGVPASSSIRASRRRLDSAGRVRFSGRVRRGGTGLVVVLQGRERGRWRTFADTRTRRRGKWQASYRFSGRPGRYPIRARIRRQTGLPYDTGYSRRVIVRVS